MTATIALSAYVDFDMDGEKDFGDRLILVGNVLPLGKGRPHRDIMVPAGKGVAPVMVDVEPGHYLCEVSVPSGAVGMAEVEALEGTVSKVTVDLDQSPHESHSWQYLIGSVESRDRYYRARPSRQRRRPQAQWRTEQYDDYGWTTGVGPWPTTGSANQPGWSQVSPMYQGEGTFLYRFTSDGEVGRASGGTGRRRFCGVRTTHGDHLVSIPAPWIDTGSHAEVPIEMMVDLDAPPGRSPITVTVRDPRLGGGLGYLASGSFDLAGKMFRYSERMLQGKMQNPLAAAAGAYALVGADDGADEPKWYRWLENLRSWQPWLPDGAILAATRRWREVSSPAQRDAARTAFLEAFQAGVPIYTIGLRWLYDGLARFAGHDPEVDDAIDQVRAFSYRVDMMQPFVVVRLGRDIW